MEAVAFVENHERPDELPCYEMLTYEQIEDEPYDYMSDGVMMDYEDGVQHIYTINTIILTVQKKQSLLQSTIKTLEQTIDQFYYEWYGRYRERYGDKSSMDYWKMNIEPSLLQYDCTIQNYRETIAIIKRDGNDSLAGFLQVCEEIDPNCIDVIDFDEQSNELIQNIDEYIEKLNNYILDLTNCLKILEQLYCEWMDSIPDELIDIIFNYWEDQHHLKYGTLAQLNKRWNNIVMTKYSKQYDHDKKRREAYIHYCRKSAYRMGKKLLDRKYLMVEGIGLNEQYVLSKYQIMGYYLDLPINVCFAFNNLIKDMKFTVFSIEFEYYEDHVKSTINKHEKQFVDFCEKFFPSYGKTMVKIIMDVASAIVEDDNTFLRMIS